MKLDLPKFQRWACGNLVENRNRGVFAEWLVGLALGVVQNEPRKEWNSYDIRYGMRDIEVKASGLGQTWKQQQPSVSKFSIGKQKWTWDADSNDWDECKPPRRTADVYVFCLHDAYPATNDNVADLAYWQFWVIATAVLDAELGDQQTVGRTTLDRLTAPVKWGDLKNAVDDVG